MKRKLFLATVMSIFICSIAFSQSRYNRGTSYTTYSSNNDHYGHTDYRSDYHRDYDRLYNRMSYRDRKCVLDLIEDLERQERRAYRDGHISSRDQRRIRNIERDIERVFLKYKRYSNYHRNSRHQYRYR